MFNHLLLQRLLQLLIRFLVLKEQWRPLPGSVGENTRQTNILNVPTSFQMKEVLSESTAY